MNSEVPDITNMVDRDRLAESISVEIDEWCEKEYNDSYRNHLGASVIGKPCSREQWYGFRHVKEADYASYDDDGNMTKHSGQTMRLFQRGHREEDAFLTYLRGIGFTFESDSQSEQIRISDVGGHFGGSVDNVGMLPARYGINERILFEFKTMNMSNFNKLKLKKEKNEKAKVRKPVFPEVFPKYWSQVCVYGYKLGLRYVFFMSVDKNTDSIWIEIVELDYEHAKSMIDKAAAIITSKRATVKYSMSPTNFACKWCDFKGICHGNEPIKKNCRSCRHATAMEGGVWACDQAGGQQIPQDFIQIGCDKYEVVEG